jgi:Zn-dependent protease with chaperone function
MHLIFLFGAWSLVWWLRYTHTQIFGTWSDRWQGTLSGFLLPPLLLFASAIAVIWMGPHGRMVWWWEGWLSYLLAIGFGLWAAIWWFKLAIEGRRTIQQVRSYSQTNLNGNLVRLIDLPTLYSAQVGFWQPELVITQGLLDALDDAHLQAVLAHEQAHRYYRDPFCFFWLGWIRQVTAWLPQSESLWQELLVLRELRADSWASQRTDTLLLAEALLLAVKNPPLLAESCCAGFNSPTQPDRLTQRIEALLAEAEPTYLSHRWAWTWLLLAFLPLLVIPFHY